MIIFQTLYPTPPHIRTFVLLNSSYDYNRTYDLVNHFSNECLLIEIIYDKLRLTNICGEVYNHD